MTTSLLPLFIILAAFIASGVIKAKSFQLLDVPQRQKVLQLAAQFQRKALLFAGVFVLLLIIVGRTQSEFAGIAFQGVLGVLVLYHLGIVAWSLSQLKEQGLPEAYIKQYQLSEIIKLVGVSALALLLMFGKAQV